MTAPAVPCYRANGSRDFNLFSCNPDDPISHCCTSGDLCLNNGLCLDLGGDNGFTTQGCTDQNWGSPCINRCAAKISGSGSNLWPYLMACNTASPAPEYCCWMGGNCCNDPEERIKLPLFKVVSKPQTSASSSTERTKDSSGPSTLSSSSSRSSTTDSGVESPTSKSPSPTDSGNGNSTTSIEKDSTGSNEAFKIGLIVACIITALLTLAFLFFCGMQIRRRAQRKRHQAAQDSDHRKSQTNGPARTNTTTTTTTTAASRRRRQASESIGSQSSSTPVLLASHPHASGGNPATSITAANNVGDEATNNDNNTGHVHVYNHPLSEFYVPPPEPAEIGSSSPPAGISPNNLNPLNPGGSQQQTSQWPMAGGATTTFPSELVSTNPNMSSDDVLGIGTAINRDGQGEHDGVARGGTLTGTGMGSTQHFPRSPRSAIMLPSSPAAVMLPSSPAAVMLPNDAPAAELAFPSSRMSYLFGDPDNGNGSSSGRESL